MEVSSKNSNKLLKFFQGNIALTAQSDTYTTHKWADINFDSHSLYSIQPSDFEVIDSGTPVPLTYNCVKNDLNSGNKGSCGTTGTTTTGGSASTTTGGGSTTTADASTSTNGNLPAGSTTSENDSSSAVKMTIARLCIVSMFVLLFI